MTNVTLMLPSENLVPSSSQSPEMIGTCPMRLGYFTDTQASEKLSPP